MLKLLPLFRREVEGNPRAPLPWESKRAPRRTKKLTRGALWSSFLRGGYPEIASQLRRNTTLWHASYTQTYLERDVRTQRQVAPGYVIHPGDSRLPLGRRVTALPFVAL